MSSFVNVPKICNLRLGCRVFNEGDAQQAHLALLQPARHDPVFNIGNFHHSIVGQIIQEQNKRPRDD